MSGITKQLLGGSVSLSRCTTIIFTFVFLAVLASLWTGLIVLRVEVILNPDSSSSSPHAPPVAGPNRGKSASAIVRPPVAKSSNTGAASGDAKRDADDDEEHPGKHRGGPRRGTGRVLPPQPPSEHVASNPKCNAGDRAKWRPGKCSFDSAWLEPWTRFRPHGNWTLVDVGANKGYVIAGWLDVLQHDSQHSPHHLGVMLFNRTMGAPEFPGAMPAFLPSHCGGCCECLDKPPRMSTANKAHSIRVFGFEPGLANYRWLSSFFDDRKTVTIRNVAAGEKSGRVYFPDVPLGVEIGKVVSAPQQGYVPVDIVKLDEELEHVDFIDVLSTDAEGFDQAVARGAESFLKNGRVGVYQFEMYAPDNYKEIFERLKTWGYECYFSTASRKGPPPPGKKKKPFFKVPMIVRITDCWEEDYQGYIGWVNGLCHNTRIEALNKIFTYLAHKSHKGGSGNCDSQAFQRRKVRDFIKSFVLPVQAGVSTKVERPVIDLAGSAPTAGGAAADDDDDKNTTAVSVVPLTAAADVSSGSE